MMERLQESVHIESFLETVKFISQIAASQLSEELQDGMQSEAEKRKIKVKRKQERKKQQCKIAEQEVRSDV